MVPQGRNKQGDVFKGGPFITLYANKDIYNKHLIYNSNYDDKSMDG